jgi:FeS assembly SUF system regulator
MIRISKLADYGIVLLTQFAREPESTVYNARDLSAAARLPLPTVSKLLKSLARADLLVSHRGSRGGYRLARGLDQISVADVLAAIEGRLAITDCSDAQEACRRETTCPVRGHWTSINEVVRGLLSELKLSQMARPPQVVALRAQPQPEPAAVGPEAERSRAAPGGEPWTL